MKARKFLLYTSSIGTQTHLAMMWSLDGVECHEQVVDHHRDAVRREQEHHEDLEPSRISELHQELVDGRH